MDFKRQISRSAAAIQREFIRGKRTSTLTASTQKVVNQLSALSASKKQPKLLNLCSEDLIKHRTITNAWHLYQRKKENKRKEQLQKQYESIYTAMEDLKQESPQLYETANAPEPAKRYPIEMRIPTEYPPTIPWIAKYKPQ